MFKYWQRATHPNRLLKHKAAVSGICGGFELLQLSRVRAALCQPSPPSLKTSCDLLEAFTLGLRDPEISKDSEAQEQHSKQDEHITIQPSLNGKEKKEIDSVFDFVLMNLIWWDM